MFNDLFTTLLFAGFMGHLWGLLGSGVLQDASASRPPARSRPAFMRDGGVESSAWVSGLRRSGRQGTGSHEKQCTGVRTAVVQQAGSRKP